MYIHSSTQLFTGYSYAYLAKFWWQSETIYRCVWHYFGHSRCLFNDRPLTFYCCHQTPCHQLFCNPVRVIRSGFVNLGKVFFFSFAQLNCWVCNPLWQGKRHPCLKCFAMGRRNYLSLRVRLFRSLTSEAVFQRHVVFHRFSEESSS